MSAATESSLRTCLGCRQVLEKKNLLRYVLSPQGDLLVDYQGKLPGRGAYTCLSSECLHKALKRRQFRRSFKRDFSPPEPDRLIEDLLRQVAGRVESLIGMARKSGALIMGSNQVLDGVAGRETLSFVLCAEDMSAGIAAKLEGSTRKKGTRLYRKFSKDKLGKMLGRDEVSVVGLKKSTLADSLELELKRYRQITEGL
ncbi:MAG TPA: DUF448 domain-containing protein [Desulfuromonadales bacterium]|nr:DUF448 domain-containing protein [Desulfuromonadales bacterium]